MAEKFILKEFPPKSELFEVRSVVQTKLGWVVEVEGGPSVLIVE
jgi:hypothetical protein